MSPVLKVINSQQDAASSIEEHMLALDINGYWMLPLGDGKAGKSPFAKFKDRKAMPLNVISDIMRKNQSSVFGVRCAGLVVIDVDTKTGETMAYCEQRFPPSPFTVKTRKGEHRYYRSGDKPPGNIVTDTMRIDIKHGKNMFVVGPGSVRPDTGDEYRMDGEPLPPIHELPVFRDFGDRSTPPADKIKASRPANDSQVDQKVSAPSVVGLDGKGVPAGERFDHLKLVARRFAQHADSEASLLEDLRNYAKGAFENFDSFPERKFHDVAKWNWEKRTTNSHWRGANAPIHVLPHELELLDRHRNGAAALRLLVELRRMHSAQVGKTFAIDGESMAEEGALSCWGRSKIYACKDTLVDCGLIRVVRFARRVKDHHDYQLVRAPFP